MFSEGRNLERSCPQFCVFTSEMVPHFLAAFTAEPFRQCGSVGGGEGHSFILMEVEDHIREQYSPHPGKQLQRCFHSFAIGVRGKRGEEIYVMRIQYIS